jgi:hypothetical protein
MRRLSLVGERAGRAAALVLLVAAACSVPNAPAVAPGEQGAAIPGLQGDVPGRPAQLGAPVDTGTAGVTLIGVIVPPVSVFGPELATVSVQPGTRALMESMSGLAGPRLEVYPLPSPDGTAALAIRELSRGAARWGSRSTPAQRAVYSRFARDSSLGAWLVVVTDVAVLDGPDPVPLTAYRWPRAAVEAYASCGIPAVGRGVPWERIDPCTDRFFLDAQTVLVRPRSNQVGQ